MKLILFLLSLFVNFSSAYVSLIKIVVIMDQPSDVFSVDQLVLKLAYNGSYAAQVYLIDSKGQDLCETIGNIDRAKSSSDIVIVFRSINGQLLDCDPEWGRQNFVIVIENTSNAATKLEAMVKFGSTEKDNLEMTFIDNYDDLIEMISKKQYKNPFSRIPTEYPFEKERQRQIERRKFLAVIAILILSICSLLAIMFIGSLKRYNSRTNRKEEKHQKKASDAVLSAELASIRQRQKQSKPLVTTSNEKSSNEELGENKSLLTPQAKTAELGQSLIQKSEENRDSGPIQPPPPPPPPPPTATTTTSTVTGVIGPAAAPAAAPVVLPLEIATVPSPVPVPDGK